MGGSMILPGLRRPGQRATLRYETRGPGGWIVLTRPERRNALGARCDRKSLRGVERGVGGP
jgi:hypothetical protein